MPPKVLVISNYHNIYSVRPEAEIFIDLAKRGYEIDVMTYPESPYVERFTAAGVNVIAFHPRKKLHKGEISFIREHIKKGKHDIVHLFNGRAILNGIQAAKNLTVKIVLYRGYAGNVHWHDPTAYLKFLHPAVDKIVCNTKAVENSLQKQLFFDKSKTEVILKGHDVKWYEDVEPIDLNKEFDLPANSFKVMSVGNSRPVKDIASLLEATYHIPSDLPIYYILIGRDIDSKKHLRLIKKSPNREKIKIGGFRKDVLNLVRATDVFVLPSLSESFPKAAVEAMSLGRPCILTDIPGNRELAVDGEHVFKVPVKRPTAIADKIMEYYHHPELRERMGQAAKARIAENGHDKTVEDYDRFYRGLVSGK